jgi:hypothetical protein
MLSTCSAPARSQPFSLLLLNVYTWISSSFLVVKWVWACCPLEERPANTIHYSRFIWSPTFQFPGEKCAICIVLKTMCYS